MKFETHVRQLIKRAALDDPRHVQNIGLWTSAIVAGGFAVAYALAFRHLEAFARTWAAAGATWYFMSPAAIFAAWAIVRFLAPDAGGSGIPQIMAANDLDYEGAGRARVDRLLSLRTMVVKVISSLLCVAGGGAIGREGPTLQISASLFHLLGRGVRRFTPTQEQTWIVAGAAAGLAAAFNTPLGGIVYAIEELGSQHFLKVRTAVLSAVIIAGVVAQIALGSYLYLGLPNLQNINVGFLPWAVVTGALSGLCGSLFGLTLYKLSALRAKLSVFWQAVAALTCGLIICELTRVTPPAIGPGVEIMTDMLFRGRVADFSLVATRVFATSVAYLSGAAGGIFAPSLAMGATVGSLLTQWLHLDHPNLMILLGMIGFLTGVVRTPFTSFILVVEMTDRHSAIFPMMIAALSAQSVAHLVDTHGFYERTKARFTR